MVGAVVMDRIVVLRERFNVKERMQGEPFFRHISGNQLSNAEMRIFFTQYYSVVRTAYRMLAAGILSLPSADSQMIKQLVRFLSTEAGETPNHLEYYLRWSAFFGITSAELAATTPNKTSSSFERRLMDIFESGDRTKMLAAQLAVEDCAEALILGLDEGFRQYPMSVRARAYLAAHLLLENDEDGHSRWAIDGLAHLAGSEEGFGVVETTYDEVVQAFTDLFQGIYDEWRPHEH